MSGNVPLAYARLNVPDGLWGTYNQPWGPEHFTEPALTVVDRDVEVSRAEVVLHARLRRISEVPGEGTVTIGRVPDGARLTVGGTEIVATAGEVVVAAPAGPALDPVLTT